MARARIILCVAAFCASQATAQAPATTAARARLVARLDSLVREQSRNVSSVGVAVYRGSDTLLLRGLGLADREAKRPAATNTIYEIASLTKQVTASAVMRLVEQGKLRLDDDIARYVPRFPLHGYRVTVRQLLNHTSGIHSFTNDPQTGVHADPLPPDSILGWIADHAFDFRPGTKMAYSNTGYTLLGMIIEKVSGLAYARFLEREFFGPLGLAHTRYCDSHSSNPLVAAGYELRDSAFVRLPDNNMSIPFAAGGICSTPAEFADWERAFLLGRVVTAASVRRMTTPDTLLDGTVLNYGFGLTLGRLGDHSAFMHGGAITGFSSVQIVLPKDSVIVVIFTNTDGYRPEPLALDLARVVVGYSPNGFGALDRAGHVSRP